MLYTQHPIDYRGNSPRFEYLPVTDEAFDEAARERGYVKAPQLSNGPSRYLGTDADLAAIGYVRAESIGAFPADELEWLIREWGYIKLQDVNAEALKRAMQDIDNHWVRDLIRQVLAALDREET